MSSILRINHFSRAANEAYASSTPQYLTLDPAGVEVRCIDRPSSFSKEEFKQNSQTWALFRRSLIETLGQQKFDWICHRYRNRMNFSQLERSGSPLLYQHVELFSVGSSQVLNCHLQTRFSQGEAKVFSRRELTEKMQSLQAFPIIGSYQGVLKAGGAWSSLFSSFVHDKLLMDKKKQRLLSDVEHLSFPSWLERMCKRLVNHELIEGQLIPAPGMDGSLDYYKVYRKVATGDGLVAYALQPAAADSTLKPLIVFRPTQWSFSNEDAFEAYYNDAQPHIGEMGWTGAEGKFKELMENDPHFRRGGQEKISVAGYSLGGAHAQYFLATYADQVSHAVFYADPSVDDQVAEEFAVKINQKPRRVEPLNIQIYRTKGDFCHYMGGKHVGWGVTHPDVNLQLIEIDHADKKASTLKLHAHCMFDNHHFSYTMQSREDRKALFDHLDNSKRGVDIFWYERMRRLWGGVAYCSFYSVSWILNLITAFSGLKILRKSNHPED